MQTELLEISLKTESIRTETITTLVLKKHRTTVTIIERVRLLEEIITLKIIQTPLLLEQETTTTNREERIQHQKELIHQDQALIAQETRATLRLLQDQTLLPPAEAADHQVEAAEEGECKHHLYFFQ
jgi:hypothetical protein